MKLFTIIILLILIPSTVFAATVQGTVYDFSLNRIKNVIIEINTTPAQKVFSTDGKYVLNVPLGIYKITAKTSLNKTITEEEIKIIEEGTFIIDLFAFPEIEEDNSIEDLEIEQIDNKKNYLIYIPILIIVILTILFLKKKKIINPKEETKENNLSDKVLEIIKKEQRISQKELRKHFPLSEAKISLVISELETKGKIEKIKKGRGNLLIFKG